MIPLTKLSLRASDVTGQKSVNVRDVPTDHSLGEVLDGLLPRMNLNRLDRSGQPIQYDIRLDREGRHLHRTELVGDALQPDDHLTLHPRIMAG
jgi:hypothetical protein